MSRLKAQWRTHTQAEIELQVREQLEAARKSWQQEQETVSDDGLFTSLFFLLCAKPA